jgi:transketolase
MGTDRLASEGVNARAVSLPCCDVFMSEPQGFRDHVLPEGVPQLVIEAGVTLGWNSYVGTPKVVIGVDRFGASAPGEVVMREYGFSLENVCQHLSALLQRGNRIGRP